jgi:hypothetical protein
LFAGFCTPHEWPVWYGSIHRVLTACSRGTHGECTGARASVGRVLAAVWVRVLTWAARDSPSSSDSAFGRGGGSKYVTQWALQRSLAHSGVGVVWCGTSGYSRGTHGVLTQYRVSKTGVPRRRGVDVSHSVAQCTAPRGAMVLCSRVLTGYSQGSFVHRRVPSAKKHTRPRALRLPCCRTVLCTVIWRLRSADARSDGHARADQRRLHQPAHARADGAADHCDLHADRIADVSRRCAPGAFRCRRTV